MSCHHGHKQTVPSKTPEGENNFLIARLMVLIYGPVFSNSEGVSSLSTVYYAPGPSRGHFLPILWHLN